MGAAVGGSVVGVDSGAQFATIVMVCAWVADKVGALESVTVTVKSKVPVAVGVPVIDPSAAAKLRPGGKVPDATDQVNGAVPPSTLNTLAEYATHSVPLGRGVHDICTAPMMLVFQPLKVLQINVAVDGP